MQSYRRYPRARGESAVYDLSAQRSLCALRLKDERTKAYIHCPDPCEYTDGGTVIFEIVKVTQPI
jgi:hypothetical protein